MNRSVYTLKLVAREEEVGELLVHLQQALSAPQGQAGVVCLVAAMRLDQLVKYDL